MAEFKKNNRVSGPRARAFTKRSSAPFPSKELFDAECNSCHNRCQVPFRPNGKKPVYCANCFTKNAPKPAYTSSFHSDSRARPQRSSAPALPDRQLEELKREVQAIHATLQELVTTVGTLNRAAALTREIQKHVPAAAETEKAAPKKKAVAVKKTAKK